MLHAFLAVVDLSGFSHLLTAGYRYHKIRKAFSEFYHRHSHLIAIYSIGFKNSSATPMLGLVFCGDLVHKFRRIVGKPNFSDQFKHIFKGYKKKFGYNMDTRRQCRPNAMISLELHDVYSGLRLNDGPDVKL